jgi:DNA-binding CsgD family transcriptional regulator
VSNPKVIKCPQCGHHFEIAELVKDVTGARVLKTLTPRQREVLYALSLGASDKELARILAISPETVRKHLNAIYEKTGMNTRLEAVLFMQTHEDLMAGCKAEAS